MTTQPLSDERLAEIRAQLDLSEGWSPVFYPSDVRALLARLDKAEAGWQDISTAPTDGTNVLVWSESSGIDVAGVGWEDGGVDVWFTGEYRVKPTYWRSLPPPPAGA